MTTIVWDKRTDASFCALLSNDLTLMIPEHIFSNDISVREDKEFIQSLIFFITFIKCARSIMSLS